MRSGIFISYRRADSKADARSVYDRLCNSFGRDSVFFDIDTIREGSQFPEELGRHLRRARVVVVLIGKNWVNARDEAGQRRLDNPNDFVRIEIEQALKLKATIIPVLLDGATLPAPSELPQTLAPLTSYQLTTLAHETFARDITYLDSIVRKHVVRGPLVRVWSYGALGTAIASAIAFIFVPEIYKGFRPIGGPSPVESDPATTYQRNRADTEKVTRDTIRVTVDSTRGASPILLVDEQSEVKSILSLFELEYAINDGEFQVAPLRNRIDLFLSGLAPSAIKRVTLKYRSPTGELAGPFNFDVDVPAGIRAGMKKAANEAQNWAYCKPATCGISGIKDYLPAIRSVNFSTVDGKLVKNVEIPEVPDSKLGVHGWHSEAEQKEVLFPSNRKDVKVELIFLDGTKSGAQIVKPGTSDSVPTFVQLTQSDGAWGAPLVFAGYTLEASPPWMFAIDRPAGFEKTFYTFDTGGFMELRSDNSTVLHDVPAVLTVSEPKSSNTLRLKFRSTNGVENGPFTYIVDWAAIATSAMVAPISADAIVCKHIEPAVSSNKSEWAQAMESLAAQNAANAAGWGFVVSNKPVTACKASGDAGWAKVSEVEYGATEHDLSSVAPVNFSESDLLSGKFRNGHLNGNSNIWQAILPGRTSVYARFVYHDGTKSEILRVLE